MQQINAAVGQALTAMQEQRTKAGQPTTASPIPKSFVEFKTFGERELEQALRASVQFVNDAKVGAEPRWLSICGASGNGKTMLAKCIAESLGIAYKSESAIVWQRRPVFYWPHIADRMKSGAWHAANDIIEPEMCVIDDVGAEHDPSKAITSALCRVIEQRLKKWTVITSNLTLAQIGEKLDTRISSRMIRGRSVVVELNTTDFNLR